MISDFVSLCESQSFLLWNKNDLLPKYFFFTTSKMETVSPRGILPRPPFLVDFGDLSLSHVKLTHPHAYTHTLTRTHAHALALARARTRARIFQLSGSLCSCQLVLSGTEAEPSRMVSSRKPPSRLQFPESGVARPSRRLRRRRSPGFLFTFCHFAEPLIALTKVKVKLRWGECRKIVSEF